jgi:hypothetical protein
MQLNFSSSRSSGGISISEAGQVLTCDVERGWFGVSWQGGLLEPAIDTEERSTAEFEIEDTGSSAGCLISIGVTALPAYGGWVQLPWFGAATLPKIAPFQALITPFVGSVREAITI